MGAIQASTDVNPCSKAFSGEGGIRYAPLPQALRNESLATQGHRGPGLPTKGSVRVDSDHFGSFGILLSTLSAHALGPLPDAKELSRTGWTGHRTTLCTPDRCGGER